MSDRAIGHGLAVLARAEEALASAATLEPCDSTRAEQVARAALGEFRSAMNWLEDTEHFEPVHERIDQAGSYVRRTFGCQLHQGDNGYEQRCPVWLAHSRVGLSPGMVIEKSQCTICGADPSSCSHITGRTYEGKFCAHLITQARITEVSLVARPAQPDARITGIGVTPSELRSQVGPRWKPGTPVSCDKCLHPCGGVVDPLLESVGAERENEEKIFFRPPAPATEAAFARREPPSSKPAALEHGDAARRLE